MKKIIILFVLASIMILAACTAPGEAATSAAATPTAGIVNTGFANALPVPSQLALGTIMLKDTPEAVTAAQAAELLPLWQALLSMTNSTSTASAVEIDALVSQIQQTMQPAQLNAIADLKITQESMATAFQDLGLNNLPSGRSGTPVARTPGAFSGGGGGNFGPNGGGPGGGPGGGGFIIEGGPGGVPGGGFAGTPAGTISPSIQSTARAQASKRNQYGNPILYNAVVEYLSQVTDQ